MNRSIKSKEGKQMTKKQQQQQQHQRVLIIAGPHKTGSSSIQNSMYHWTLQHNHNASNSTNTTDTSSSSSSSSSSNAHFQNWSWPAPDLDQVYQFTNHQESMHWKIFYPFGEALHNCQISKHKGDPTKMKEYCLEIMKYYRKEFYTKWKEGYNLIIGTEALDLVGANKGAIRIDDLLEQLPFNYKNDQPQLQPQPQPQPQPQLQQYERLNGSNEDITVVIKYRSPRVKHLISWWHECCMNQMNFLQFLQLEMAKRPDRGSRIVDSLQLVQRFLDYGLHVVLIDLGGVGIHGYDVSNVIACDVMGIPCNHNKIIEGETEEPQIKNQKKGGDMGNITVGQMEEIEQIIRKRDCTFKHFLNGGHDKLEMLYASELKVILEACEDGVGGISRSEMNQQIIAVASQNGGSDEK